MGQSMNTVGDFYWVDCRRGGIWGALSGLVSWFWLMLSLFAVLIISTEIEVGVCQHDDSVNRVKRGGR